MLKKLLSVPQQFFGLISLITVLLALIINQKELIFLYSYQELYFYIN